MTSCSGLDNELSRCTGCGLIRIIFENIQISLVVGFLYCPTLLQKVGCMMDLGIFFCILEEFLCSGICYSIFKQLIDKLYLSSLIIYD